MGERKYIHWQAEGVEKIPPSEQEDIQAVADMINAIQKAQWNSHRHCFSGMQAWVFKELPLTISEVHMLVLKAWSRASLSFLTIYLSILSRACSPMAGNTPWLAVIAVNLVTQASM